MVTQVANPMAARVRREAVSGGIPIPPVKITAPSVPDWTLTRPRITKLIAQSTRWCPLTVVTGPAGAGKTTALALWAAAQPGTVAWVRLDGYDNQPEVFWSYVLAALRRSGVTVPTVPSAARRRAGNRVFLVGLAAALAAQDPPVTLILDDLHLLTSPQVLDGLDYVLRNVGAGLRLVVSARMEPLLLHRYRLAGELTEIRASDLAFTVPEAGELMDRHGITLTADSLRCLIQRTEGWAAGLRLAAISLSAHPDPDQLVTELITDDSAVTGYLVAEVLNPQPAAVRELLLNTSILEHVSGEAASELTGNEEAGMILPALARANAFVQPAGAGRYRYHTLFAEVLRMKLKGEHPDRLAPLHRRAARWYQRNGQLTDAVRHAAQAGDWPLAAGIVIDQLAIGEILELRGSPALASEFKDMPHRYAWTEPAPLLVSAAIALAAGRHEDSMAALEAAGALLGRLPADQEAAGRLAAALIRLTASRRTGDLATAAAAVNHADALVSRIPDTQLARRRNIRGRLLSGRGAVELWSGQFDQAAGTLESVEPDDGLGYLALAEALRGRPGRAAALAGQATAVLTTGEPRLPNPHSSPAGLVALALVHLGHNELRAAHRRLNGRGCRSGPSPGQAGHGGRLAGRGVRWPGPGARRRDHAERSKSTIRVVGSGLARRKAEPGRIVGARHLG